MKMAASGFLFGVLILQQLELLPTGYWVVLLPLLVLLLWYSPRFRFPLMLGIGFLWALMHAQLQIAPSLEPSLEGEDLQITGIIDSIPEKNERRTRFYFDAESAELDGQLIHHLPQHIRLSWYGDAPNLRLGQRWTFTVRLKRPWGFMNPGGFDYEAWLFQHRVRATGYVRSKQAYAQLPVSRLSRPIGRLRQSLHDRMRLALPASDNIGVLTALTVGERGGIEPHQWQLLIDTGTNHLLAISGLHIGLVAGLVFWVVFRLWRYSSRLCLAFPAQRAAALSAIIFALFYALMAGFTVPTQRALVMLTVVLVATTTGRTITVSQVLSVALLAVLLWDPLAVMSAGFWLSFTAVACIAYVMAGRLHDRLRGWQSWGKLQWVLAVGLLPLGLLFFQRSVLVAPLANLIAVPWVSFVVVPLTLLGSTMLLLWAPLGQLLLGVADHTLDLMWHLLEMLATLPHAKWQHAPPGWAMWPAVLGVLLLLAPRGWPARWLGVVMLAPLLVADGDSLDVGEFRMTLLDVGQGLAAVIQTREHVLVYDTGARFSNTFNAGDAVILPYLRKLGVRGIDTLMISHGDNDHIGGTTALLAGISVGQVIHSTDKKIDHAPVQQCVAGQQWQWDNVQFNVLGPAADWYSTDNNRSCVLRVSNAGGSVLLTGDIESHAEKTMLRQYGDSLRSSIILVPHHGSRTSSTTAFVGAVNPDYALVSSGYRNRFGFPKADIVKRYEDRGIEVLITAETGAMAFRIHPQNGVELLDRYRHTGRRYWTSMPATTER